MKRRDKQAQCRLTTATSQPALDTNDVPGDGHAGRQAKGAAVWTRPLLLVRT